MNKTIKQNFGIIIVGLAVLIFFMMIWFLVKDPYEDYSAQTNKSKKGRFYEQGKFGGICRRCPAGEI